MATVIPQGNDERVTWALNFEDKFPLLGADLGFSAAEMTALGNDSAMMRYAVLNGQTAAVFSKTCTAYKNAMLGGVGENLEAPKVPLYNAIALPTDVDAGVLERLSNAIQRAKLSATLTNPSPNN